MSNKRLLREYVRSLLSAPSMEKQVIDVAGADCEVEIAKTDLDRAIGMMGRQDVPDGTGMLFIYEEPMQLSFWMRNTPCWLDIAFIDQTGMITDIRSLKPFSEESVKSSSSNCVAALEVPRGWFGRNGISVGDTIRFR